MNKVLCLDTSVLIPYLVTDEYEPLADSLVLEAVVANARLVAKVVFKYMIRPHLNSPLAGEPKGLQREEDVKSRNSTRF